MAQFDFVLLFNKDITGINKLLASFIAYSPYCLFDTKTAFGSRYIDFVILVIIGVKCLNLGSRKVSRNSSRHTNLKFDNNPPIQRALYNKAQITSQETHTIDVQNKQNQ